MAVPKSIYEKALQKLKSVTSIQSSGLVAWDEEYWPAIQVVQEHLKEPGAWARVPVEEGLPFWWAAVRQVPQWISKLHAAERQESTPEGLRRKANASAWQVKNAMGEDLWFAALNAQNTYIHPLLAKNMGHLKIHCRPQLDQKGRGWLVAHPELLRKITVENTFPLRRNLRKWIAEFPEFAFAGSEDQHRDLAAQIWTNWKEEQWYGRALVELAQWTACVSPQNALITEPLRGLFIETMGYALNCDINGMSNLRYVLWRQSDKDKVVRALEEWLKAGPWEEPASLVPLQLDNPSAQGVLFKGLTDNPDWAQRRQSVFRHIRLEHMSQATPISSCRRYRS